MSSTSPDPKRNLARELAQTHLAQGDALGWFEPLYAEAQGDAARVPWADLKSNPNLTDWLDREAVRGDGRSALVVGCGLGDDAELLAARGFHVTAFDVAASAIDWCRRRFPTSSVRYEAADLLNPPPAWNGAFDFVLEAYTLQVLKSAEMRRQAINRLAAFPRPGGTVLVICRGRETGDPEGQMPWPLLRDELTALETSGLSQVAFEDFWDQHEAPAVRRFRALYRRPTT
ncbi:MAG TPA: class I SAM-dependent methyltransferase [Planctomycetaceae bacterium]|jgi:SAM-dependent methyltransferase|nr:class I SAM-dependent methyltransferase [Planctomycetaceae bacterium]